MSKEGAGQPAPFLLSTVRHSGTHSAIEIFKPHYQRFQITEDIRDYDPPLKTPYWFAHCEPEQMPLIRKRRGDMPVVHTMRNPMDVARSWIKRGVVMNGWFRNMWRNLFALQDEFGGLWLPVDTQDRDMRLRAISARLGVSLTTDWTPKNATESNLDFIGGMTLEDCSEFYKTLPFEQFGYNTKTGK